MHRGSVRWLAAFALAVAAAPAEAGWVQPPGAHYLKLWDQLLVGSRAFGTDGAIVELPGTYVDQTLRAYFEYGLEPALTLVLHGVLAGLCLFDGEAAAYAGPLSVGLRAGLARGDVPFAIELAYGYGPALGGRALAEGVSKGVPFRVRPSFEQHLASAEAQLGFSGFAGWAKATAGLVASSAPDVGGAFEASLRAGRSWDSWEADLGLSAHLPLRALERVDVLGNGATRYVGFQIGVGYWITPALAVRLDLGFGPIAESNAATPSIGVGVASR